MSDFEALVEQAARGVFGVIFFRAEEATEDDYQIVKALYERAATAALEAVGLPALLERVKAAEGEGCDCTELCSMGPTCPGGTLAGLDGSGCWRTGVTE